MCFSFCFFGVGLREHRSVFCLPSNRSLPGQRRCFVRDVVDSGELHLSNESGVVLIGCRITVKVNNIWPFAFLKRTTCANVANQPLASMSVQESVRPSDENEAFYLHCRAAYLAVFGSSLTNISSKQQLCRGKQTSLYFTEKVGPVATKMMETHFHQRD